MRNLILLLISALAHAQSDVPEKYWIDDSNFEDVVGNNNAFGDDNNDTIVVEFWAKFNDVNSFEDWNKLKGITHYYKCDISTSPEVKREYRIRMAPTILIFKDGILEESFKAGLDLECPVNLEELQKTIDEIKHSSQF